MITTIKTLSSDCSCSFLRAQTHNQCATVILHRPAVHLHPSNMWVRFLIFHCVKKSRSSALICSLAALFSCCFRRGGLSPPFKLLHWQSNWDCHCDCRAGISGTTSILWRHVESRKESKEVRTTATLHWYKRTLLSDRRVFGVQLSSGSSVSGVLTSTVTIRAALSVDTLPFKFYPCSLGTLDLNVVLSKNLTLYFKLWLMALLYRVH